MSIYEDLKLWRDCSIAANAYNENNITSHAQAWDMLVASDKHEWLIWLALHAPAVPRESVKAFLDVTVERAIRRAIAVCAEPAFLTWAERWLSGEDRTYAAAAAVRVSSTRKQPLGAACAAAAYTARAAWNGRAEVASGAAVLTSVEVTSEAAALTAVELASRATRTTTRAEALHTVQVAAMDARADEIRQQADWWRKQNNPFK